MKSILFLLPITLFIFSGCTTKSVTLPLHGEKKVTQRIPIQKGTNRKIVDDINTDTDEFEDEFSSKEADSIVDPLSGYNRFMTSFNDKVFTYALEPISEGYAYVTPEPIRESLSNFVHNIQFPIRFVNNLLQGKFQNTSDELERFIVNSTVGLGGLFDPAATYMHIPAHNEDFGQTLGHYGVGAGFHVVLPFLGPSNVRDVLGLTADAYTSPLQYQKGLKKYKIPDNYGPSISIYAANIVNKNSLHLGAYESLKKDAIDLYPFLRDIYEQKRISDIKE